MTNQQPSKPKKNLYQHLEWTAPIAVIALVVLVGGIWRLFGSSAASGQHAECTKFTVSATSVPQGTSTISATIVMKNDGTTVWSPNYGFYLGTVGSTNWNMSGAGVVGNTNPGQSETFNVTAHVPSSAGSYSFQPALYIVFNPPIQNYCIAKTITVTAPPSPTPSPQPSPKPSPTGGTTRRSSSTSSGSSPTTSPADTTPPSVPSNFQAKVDNTDKSVLLSWTASTDNVGVVGYILERSSDQQNWQQLGDTLTQTNYEDFTTAFGATYYYRVKALDGSNNFSGYATAQTSTTNFQSNVTANQDSTVISNDKTLSILIPSGSLSEDAFCTIDSSTDVLAPNINNYVYISGPFVLNCRDSAGNVLASFNKSLVLTAHEDASQLKGIGQVAYFGQKDDGSWQNLKVTKHDKTKSLDTVSLDKVHVFSVMGKRKTTPFWLKLIEIILILGLLLFGVRFVVRLLLKRKAVADYDEYLRKSQGL